MGRGKGIIVYNETYDFDLMIQRGGLVSDLCNAFRDSVGEKERTDIVDNKNRRGHFTSHTNTSAGGIWLHEKARYGTISHETLHATCHLFRYIGLPLTEDTEEAYTYMQQWMMNTIVKKLY